ncbi:spermidine/putrescine ABC transporter substrate-binding protein [Rhizobiaceae bacterium BDR2-2]|uniref:Spermidine/putrescine ABC transporter substrate-binding protein n=1 Tax=Ectorhizobium quercum TaxID=2965071 RepID=A0AAE3MXA9_9HYPH|nr:spermidine/putrescine ABC transporter substrate-binding protein [Ectorhizobium quercum]MCX8995986.1 spermidine/putrescine ABC transporter substrate-binding protein [Ectorhizobium quercum]
MEKIFFAGTLLAASVFPAIARAETLNLLIWEQYISEKVLETWTEETGVQIRQIYYDNGDDRDRLLADPNSNIDLAILNENITGLYSRNGMLVEVSDETVPSARHSVARWRERCVGYGLPYFWGTLGIVYRSDKIETAPTSWNDLLEPSADLSGHLAMVTGYDDLLSPPLILAGKSVSSENEDELKEAFEMLKAQAPSVRTYDYIMTSSQDAAIGDQLHMALAYSGDQFTLSEISGKPWKYVLPQEGSVIWVDCLAANAKSPRRDLAVQFLDFINRPDIAVRNAIDLSMPTANQTAIPLLPDEMKNNPEIFPPEEIVAASQFYYEYSAPIIQLRKRIVSAVTGLHDAR